MPCAIFQGPLQEITDCLRSEPRLESAPYSLDRDIAICTIIAAMGPTIIMTRAAIGLDPLLSVSSSSEYRGPLCHLCKVADGACDRGGNGTYKDISMLDMGKFMCDHAFEFLSRENSS